MQLAFVGHSPAHYGQMLVLFGKTNYRAAFRSLGSNRVIVEYVISWKAHVKRVPQLLTYREVDASRSAERKWKGNDPT